MKDYKKLMVGSLISSIVLASQLTYAVGLEINFLGIIKDGLKLPTGVVANSAGKIFVADKVKNKILMYDETGKFIKSTGGEKGKNLGQLNQPVDLDIYKDKLYVLEQGNNRISCLDFDLNFINTFGLSGKKNGEFSSPGGIAIDHYGDVYVADTKNTRVQILNLQGIFYSSIGDKTIFNNPVDVAVDSLRNIYVLDSKKYQVFKFSPEGNLLLSFGSMGKGTAQFTKPTSIAVDKKGYIYIADQGNFRLQVFDKEGKFVEQFGSQGKERGQFEKLISVYVDEQNRLFLADEKTMRIQYFSQEEKPGLELPSFPPFVRVEFKKILSENTKAVDLAIDNESNLYLIDDKLNVRVFDKDLKEKFQLGQKGSFKKPTGIAVSSSKIYVLDGEKNQVLVFDTQGKFLFNFGRKGKDRGQIASPSGMALDKKENVFIADTMNFRIVIFDKDGIFKNTFGKRGQTIEDLQLPTDLVVDSQGNVYVLDQRANCVKKFTSDGKFILTFGKEQFLKPTDIFIDETVIYITDAGNQRMYVFNTAGELLGSFGSEGKQQNNLIAPNTFVINKEGNIYIGNLSGRIQLFSLNQLSSSEKGNYYQVKDKIDLAQIEYKKAIEQNPQETKAYINLAQIYINTSKFKESADLLEKAIKNESQNTDILQLLGKTYSKLGKFKEAKEAYRQVIELAPKFSQTYYELALIYEKEKDYSSSIISLKEAMKIEFLPIYEAKLNEIITLWEKSDKNRPSLEIDEVIIDRIFSAIYKYYNGNPIGKIRIRNNTNSVLKQIKIGLLIKEFMDFDWEIKIDEMEPFSTEEIPLFATFNDKILSITEDTPILTKVTITYYEKDEEKSTSITKSSTLYSKNALLWREEEMIVAFITPQSAPIREVTTEVIRNFRGDHKLEKINEKLATAMILFNALSAYGMVYSPDPANPYNKTSLKADVVDYVQFPFETLKYKGGDCDDLTTLFASCLEAEGVNTTLVTSPGHIFLILATDVLVEQIQMLPFNKEMLVVLNDKVWIPVEVTKMSSSFLSAWYQGAKEYKKWEKEGKLEYIDTHKAWEKYQTGTWRDVDFHPQVPAKEKIAQLVYKDMETLSRQAFETLTDDYRKLLEIDPQDINALNQLGIAYGKFELYDDAIRIFEQIIKIKGDNAEAYCNLGNIYYLQDKFDLAITQYKLSLELAPNNAITHINLSLVYFKNKMLKEARESFQKAVELNPAIDEQYGEFKNLLF